MPKRVCLLVPLALFSFAACGDDAAPGDGSEGQAGSAAGTSAGGHAGASAGSGAAAAGTGAGGRSGSGAGGAGGLGSPGGMEEGEPCMGASDCATGLRCAGVPGLMLSTGVPVGVCGKPCAMDDECGDGAVCYAYSDMDRDKHCVDVIEEDFALCGIAETSVCGVNRVCLVFDTPVVGLCATLCQTGASDDDAGVPSGEPGGAGCASGQSCIGGVLADAMAGEGICGKQVARGAECGIDLGVGDFCGPGDVCAPDDVNDAESPVRCYQECSRAEPQCDTGTCAIIPNAFGYCL